MVDEARAESPANHLKEVLNMCNNCPGCYTRLFVQKEMCKQSPMYKEEKPSPKEKKEELSPEEKVNHILFDDDISDVRISEKDMKRVGISLIKENSEMIEILKGLEGFYSSL